MLKKWNGKMPAALASFAALGVLLAGMPLAKAHVKWFVNEENIEAIEGFSLSETAVQGWIAIVIIGLLLAAVLEKKLKVFAPWQTWSHSNKEFFVWLFQLGIGLSLVVNAAQGSLLIPTAPTNTGWRLIEAIAGFTVLIPGGAPLAAGFLLLMWGMLAFTPGGVSLLEYSNWAGIALFLLLIKSTYREWAIPILRWTAGLSLLILAFTEKLFNAPLAITLLEKYPMNFMKYVGFENFGDRLFILSAGSAEALFGIIFLLGWITRLNTLTLAIFLVSSNLYFFANGQPQEGFTELIGHLPIVVSAMLLLVYGSGEKLKNHITKP